MENRLLSRQRREQGQRSHHSPPLCWYARPLLFPKGKLLCGFMQLETHPPLLLFPLIRIQLRTHLGLGLDPYCGSKASLCSPGTSFDLSSVCVSSCRVMIRFSKPGPCCSRCHRFLLSGPPHHNMNSRLCIFASWLYKYSQDHHSYTQNHHW